MKPKQRDIVRSSTNTNSRLYHGVRQGYRTKDVIYNEKLEKDPEIDLWTEDDFEPKQVSMNQQYYCSKCKHFMSFQGVKDTFACKNNRCEAFLKFININDTKPLNLIDIDLKEISDDSDDEPYITSIKPDELDEKYTLYDRKTVEYSSPDGRIQKIRWRGYPKADLV